MPILAEPPSALLSFSTIRPRFIAGTDTPRAYLEKCLDAIAEREEEVRAFSWLNAEEARAQADRSTARYQAGNPLSVIDGMPLGIKDIINTADMPTEMGKCIFFRLASTLRCSCCLVAATMRRGAARQNAHH